VLTYAHLREAPYSFPCAAAVSAARLRQRSHSSRRHGANPRKIVHHPLLQILGRSSVRIIHSKFVSPSPGTTDERLFDRLPPPGSRSLCRLLDQSHHPTSETRRYARRRLRSTTDSSNWRNLVVVNGVLLLRLTKTNQRLHLGRCGTEPLCSTSTTACYEVNQEIIPTWL
jgi:hypothetical protein